MRTLATLAVVAAVSLSACRQNGFHVNGFSFGDWEQTQPRTDDVWLETEGALIVDVASAYGDVAVVGSDDRLPRVVATIRASAASRTAAEDMLARSRVDVTRSDDTLRVRVVTDPAADGSSTADERGALSVDFVVHVPRGIDVHVDCGSGDIDVGGEVGAVQLATDYGSVAVAGAEGDVKVVCGSGDVEARTLEGGFVDLSSSYGDVEAEGVVATRISLSSGSGDITLASARAEAIELRTDYGSVDAQGLAGAVTAHSSSGSVDIEALEGSVDATSSYGDVDVAGVLERIVARSGSGDVEVVALAGSSAASGWTLESSYGTVDLTAPANLACRFDARTGYGDIECGYPLTIEAGMKSDERLAGTINGGGGLVELIAGSGDVRLRVR